MQDFSLDKFIGRKVVVIDAAYPILTFDEAGFLTIECSWRLRDGKTILVGCCEYKEEKTHEKAHIKLENLILNKKIASISFISPVSDLHIDFENGLRLELFSDSSIYESWTLSDGNGFELISVTAGDYCVFNQ